VSTPIELAITLAFFALAATLLLLYAGFGITRMLAFPAIRGDELLVMPVVGLAVIVSAGYWCGWMGWSAATTLWLVAVVPAGFNLAAVIRPRSPLGIARHLPAVGLAAAVFAVAAVPATRSGTLGPIGVSGDQVLYANLATYLEQSGVPAPAPSDERPATVQLGFINWGLPLGFSYLHAVVDRLVKLPAHETVSLMTAFLIALNILAYPFLASCLFGLGAPGRLVVTMLAAVSPMLMGVHYGNYGMHAASLGLVPMAFGMAVLSLEDRAWRAAVLAGLLLAALFTTYPLGAGPFALAPLAIYVLLRSWSSRERLIAPATHLARIAALGVLLLLPGVVHVARLLPLMASFVWVKEFGNVDRHVPWTTVYGLSHHQVPSPAPAALFPGWEMTIGVGAAGLALYGAWRATGPARLALASLAVAYVPFILWLRLGHDYPYGFFKALTFAVFPVLVGLAAGADSLLAARRPAAIGATGAIVGGVLATNLSVLVPLFRGAPAPDIAPAAALSDAAGMDRDTTVHVRDDRDTELLWVTYFLKRQSLALGHESPYFLTRDWRFYQKPITADLVLVRNDTPLSEPWSAGPRYANSRYALLRKNAAILAHLDFWSAPRFLLPGQELTIGVRPDAIGVDQTSFPLRTPLPGRPLVLRLGAFVPAGAVVRIAGEGRPETQRAVRDAPVIERLLPALPARLSLASEGDRGVLLPGWVELAEPGTLPPITEGALDRLPAEVLPGSGFLVVDGWHGPEPGLRWTRARALAVFRTPPAPASLVVEGMLLGGQGPTARLVLNGHQLGQIDQPGRFEATFELPPGILGPSAWSELRVTVDKVFNPGRMGLSGDNRDLGVAFTRLELTPGKRSTLRSPPGNRAVGSRGPPTRGTSSSTPGSGRRRAPRRDSSFRRAGRPPPTLQAGTPAEVHQHPGTPSGDLPGGDARGVGHPGVRRPPRAPGPLAAWTTRQSGSRDGHPAPRPR
jgi:hypothetical protein